MATFRPTFHNSLASEFVNNVYYGRKTLHYFLGKVDPWKEYTAEQAEEKACDCECEACVNKNGTLIPVKFGDTSNPHNDPDNAYFNETSIRDGILYIHKIAPDDISIVTSNNKWLAEKSYSQWDNTKDMTNHLTFDRAPFFITNSEYNVYKCLSNNKRCVGINAITGEPEYEIPHSVDEPRGINYDVVKTNDGYIWKYMYSIPTIKKNKFVNTKYIPVQRAVDENFYTYGSVEGVAVLNEGSGYSSDPKTTATIDPPRYKDGELVEGGVAAKIQLFVNDETGSIQVVHIIDGGSGYLDGIHPKITINDRGKLGRGKYNTSELDELGNPLHNETALLTAHVHGGKVVSVTIDDPGINYLADIETTLSVAGDGEGCILYPVIVDGRIVDVIIGESGVGYTYITIAANCAKNAANIVKATFKGMIGGSEIDSDQSVVEQLAIPGAIYAIEVTNPGGDYHRGSVQVVIDGDGEGCTAHAVVRDGKIEQVIVDNYGKGYTTATISFYDSERKVPNVNPEAEAYAILPPHNGHGYNAVEELYGSVVSIYSNIRDDGELSNLGQEFRQYGIIANLRGVNDNKLIKDSTSIILFDVEIDPEGSISENLRNDSIVKIGNTPYRVVNIDGYILKLQQMSYIYKSIDKGDSIVFEDLLSKKVSYYKVKNVIRSPRIDKYTGDMYYINNNLPFVLESGRTFGLRSYIAL